ncbi:MAG: protein phosphatase 2C domain-containing protein [Salaquimonas sp.]
MTETVCWSGDQTQGKRNYQEDYYKIIPPNAECHQLVCILADGMGGHAAGDVASKLAVEAFRDEIRKSGNVPHSQFLQALDAANRAIVNHITTNPEANGMGTTLVGLELDGDQLHWISVGDSILYQVSGSSVKRLNANHSMAPQLDAAAKRGEITREEALNSPSRNALLSALTGDPVGRVDISRTPWKVGSDDLILLASDGLETLAPEKIGELLLRNANGSAEHLCKTLLDAIEAENSPGQDNTTIIVARPFSISALGENLRDKTNDDDEVITRAIEPR